MNIIRNVFVAHREEMKRNGEKERIKGVRAVRDGLGGWAVAARAGHRPVSLG